MGSKVLKTSEVQVDGRISTTNESFVKFDEKDPPKRTSGLDEKVVETSGLDKVVESSGLDEELVEVSSSKRLKAPLSGISEINRVKTLEDVFKEDIETALSKICYEPKETLMKRLKSLVFRQDSSSVATTKRFSGANCPDTSAKSHKLNRMKVSRKRMKRNSRAAIKKCNISKIFKEEGYKENITFMQLLGWVEEKNSVIKALSTNSEEATEDRIRIIENILEDVKKANRPIASKSEGMSSAIGTLEKNALSLLKTFKTAKNCYGIKNLFTLVIHLSATAGTQVTAEKVQKYINSDRVFNLHKVFKKQRKQFMKEIEMNKKYIEHGLEETQIAREEYKERFQNIEDIYSKSATSSDMQEINLKLKSTVAEYEEFLNRYKNAIGYLVTKTKVALNLGVEMDSLMPKFLAQKIKDLFKAGV